MLESVPLDLVNQIIDYEDGRMTDEEENVFFQQLIDTGLISQLQGSYQRMAFRLIEAGYCHKNQDKENHQDG